MDKKGILSYPNPSPEKVFFLQNPPEESQTELNDSDSLTENKDYHHHREKYEKKHKKTDPGNENKNRPQQLLYYIHKGFEKFKNLGFKTIKTQSFMVILFL